MAAEEAAQLIFDGDTVAIGGFVGIAVPEALLIALANRFEETGGPRDLTLVFAAGQGDGGDRGLNRVAREGLIRRVIGAHWGLVPALGALALEARIEAYCMPLGVMSHLYRETAAGRPGLITRVGMGTFVDPALDGGRMNPISTEEVVRSIQHSPPSTSPDHLPLNARRRRRRPCAPVRRQTHRGSRTAATSERLYLTIVSAFTAATLIGFFTTTVAKHRERRSPAGSAQADRNLRPR